MVNFYSLFIVLGSSIFLFKSFLFKNSSYSNIYFFIVIGSLIFYTGSAISFEGIYRDYWIYYYVYILFVFAGLMAVKPNKRSQQNKLLLHTLKFYIEKLAKPTIILFFLIKLARLAYPQNLLYRLIDPPSPDLLSAFGERFEIGEPDLITTLFVNIEMLLVPFFYLSLFIYRKNILKLILILAAVSYITYCQNAYYGRGGILISISLIFFVYYIENPHRRKRLLIALALIVPNLIIFFVKYTQIRLGAESIDVTFIDAFQTLLIQETSFPLHFQKIYDTQFDSKNINEYLAWLLTLPSPISLNFKEWDFALNYKISELLLGIPRGNRGFYVLLPSLIGEAYFVFGSLFFIHGFLYGMIVGGVYKIFRKYPQFMIIYIYMAFRLGYYCVRGGTAASYPFIFKQILYFLIILYVLPFFTNVKLHK